MRGPKVYHDRLRSLNAPDVVIVDPVRRDLSAREPLRAEVHLSSYGGPGAAGAGGTVDWELRVDGADAVRGRLDVEEWPDGGAIAVGAIETSVPDVARASDATLAVTAHDAGGHERAASELRFAVVPSAARATSRPLDVAVIDPLDIWGVTDRVLGLGHRLAAPENADLIVATEVSDALLDALDHGGRGLVLARTRSAIPEGHDLARRVSMHLRRLPHSGWPGQRSPWEGDWVTSWCWIDHAVLTGLPARNPLDFAYEEVLPDHVLLGYDPQRHRDEVPAGMFVGWVHTPAALVWTFRQGRGAVTLTTLRVAPESGPVATLLLERLIQHAHAADRRTADREQRVAEASR
jgi:hypothetical protein